MKLFARLECDAPRQETVFADEEAALDFAMDWVELVLFGDCPTLRKRD
jgi:hypothetical protein